jgi:hypothetical protein
MMQSADLRQCSHYHRLLSTDNGGATGLLLKDYKGKDADQPVYKVDTRLLAELRAHEKQAAEELGQWSEKRELTGDALQNEITIRFIRPGEALSTPA